MKSCVVASLYMGHCSGSISDFSLVYIGSKSMRVGINWLVLGAFCDDGAETVMDLFERMGVERLMDGRLRAAGLISKSGILQLEAAGGGCETSSEAVACGNQHSARRICNHGRMGW